MRYRNAVSVTFALALISAPGVPAQSSAASIAKGKTAFAEAGCIACHGAQAQGTNLAPAIAPPPLDLPEMVAYVRQPTGKMPPVPVATVSDEQLSDVYRFLQSLSPEATSVDELKGNAENGKKLFAAYGCYECHGRQGAGASTGPRIGPPALTLVAVVRYVRAPTGQMPPYTAKVVSDQDLADIYAFLKSFPPPKPAKDIPLLNQ